MSPRNKGGSLHVHFMSHQVAGIFPIPSVASPPEGSDFASPPCPHPKRPWLMGEPGAAGRGRAREDPPVSFPEATCP